MSGWTSQDRSVRYALGGQLAPQLALSLYQDQTIAPATVCLLLNYTRTPYVLLK